MQTSCKLLIITDDAVGGGTAHVARKLALGLAESHAVGFASGYGCDDAFLSPLADKNIPLFSSSATESNLDQSTYAMRKARLLLSETKPEFVLFVDAAELSSMLALKGVARECGIPYAMVINLLSEDCLERFSKYINRSIEAARHATDLIFVSEANRHRFEKFFPDEKIPLHVVPNGISDIFFAPKDLGKRAHLRRELGVNNDALLCLTAARLEPRKGQALVVEALSRLPEVERSHIHLVFAGKGHQAELLELIDRLGLEGRVRLLGARSDMPDLLDASDLFILSSFAEGMPLCIGEALAKGVPVVASDVDGIPEQIDPSCGALIPAPGLDREACVASLAEALKALLADRERRARMSEAAASKARRLFTLQGMQLAYRGIIGPRVASGRSDVREEAFNWAPLEGIDFSDPAATWDVLEDGWSTMEKGGLWTSGKCSKMRFNPGHPGRPVRLEFTVDPFTNARWPTQETDVYVNGRLMASWILSGGRRTMALDLGKDLGEGDIEIIFEHRRAMSPEKLGLSADPRELALFFSQMTVRETGALQAMLVRLKNGLWAPLKAYLAGHAKPS